jgi:uncharacterized protein (DUF924 family)
MATRFSADSVLDFWFPNPMPERRDAVTAQAQWWFRGGADAAIVSRFVPLWMAATRGELDDWADSPRTRLALILVLDRFSRGLHGAGAAAFSQDAKACALSAGGLDNGQYAALTSPWEKTFFFLPLGHSEDLRQIDRAVVLADTLAATVPETVQWWFDFSCSQARGNREIVKRFGRQPDRNAALGRRPTLEERAFVAASETAPLHEVAG